MWPWCSSNQQERAAVKAHRKIEKFLRDEREHFRRLRRVYVSGMDNSGATTLLKQIRIVYGGGYSEEARQAYTKLVFQDIFTAIKALTNAMTSFDISYSDPENQLYAQAIQDVETKQVTTLEPRYADGIRRLWADQGVKTCYSRRGEFKLLDSTEYFMNNLDRIAAPGYLPSDQDILRTKASTGGLHECSFDMGEHFISIWECPFHKASRVFRYSLLEAEFLIVVASLSEYDQFWTTWDRSPEYNLLREHSSLFNMMVCNRYFHFKSFILLLNKKDVLAEKIQTSHLQTYFPEFTGEKGDAEAAMDFIRGLYLGRGSEGRKQVYVHFTCAIDPENIRLVFRDVKDNVLARSLQNCRLE